MRQRRRLAILISTLSCSLVAAAAAQGDLRGPALAAASNFSQGSQAGWVRMARSLGIEDFRDGMNWARAEPEPGRYDFTDARTGYPDVLGRDGARVGVVLNWGSPLYDDGDTPQSEEAVAAFGRFAGTLVERFDAIDNLEIGNEFNGTNFVSGPVAEMGPLERARAYVPMLESATKAARSVRPDIRILGGATHSLPAAYLWEVLDAGGTGVLDALAVHPYTTPAEQFVRQVGVLRRHPDAADLPLEVTEFGHPEAQKAADHFLRNYCQMALAGVTRAAWYPMNARGDGMVPLFTREGKITPAGRAYRLIASRMEDRPVIDAASDPFTYGCRFGEDVLVLWGAPRAVEVGAGTKVLDATGTAVAGPVRLDPESARVFVRPGGDVADSVTLGDHGVLADSFHQFAYPEAGAAMAESDGFERFARNGPDEMIPLGTMPGQQEGGVPWFPYLGNRWIKPAYLTAETLVPGRRGGEPLQIVHRYVAPDDMEVRLEARFDPAARSEDGIDVAVTLDGEMIERAAGKMPVEIDRMLRLEAGDALDLSVGPNGTMRGDVVSYRITLLQP